jgi:hypothetical protein
MTKAVMKITVGEGKYRKCGPIILALCSLTHLIYFGKFLLYLTSSTNYNIRSKSNSISEFCCCVSCRYWDVNYYRRRQMESKGEMNFIESVIIKGLN